MVDLIDMMSGQSEIQSEYSKSLSNLREIMQEFSTQHYLMHGKDIRKCPSKDCKEVGFLPPLVKGVIQCSEPFKCSSCNTSWKDPLQNRNFVYYDPEILWDQLSNLVKILRTQPCPNCKLYINKNGGCRHMVCPKCNFEFCWDCLGAFPGYTHIYGEDCPYRVFFMYGQIALITLICSATFLASIAVYLCGIVTYMFGGLLQIPILMFVFAVDQQIKS